MAFVANYVFYSYKMLRSICRSHLTSVDSTNSHAKRLILRAALDPGALHVITAAEQTAGRGRLSRSWVSSADDIKMTFAFMLPPGSMSAAYLLSPLLAVSACKAVAAATPQRLGIKWPNDLISKGSRKVGGILCEVESAPAAGSRAGADYWAVLGLGLNVNSMPETLAVERAVWPLSTLRAEAAASTASDERTDAAGTVVEVARDVSVPEPSHPPLLDKDRITEEVIAAFAEVRG